jgi:hypothetical protein
MSIIDNFKFAKKEKTSDIKPVVETFNGSVESMNLSAVTDLPKIKEKKNQDWVDYGDSNLYPQFLQDMYNTSPTHNAIVKTKSEMVIGEGYTYDDVFLDEAARIEVLKILKQIEKESYELSNDFQLYGAMAFEIIWSLDFSKVVLVNRLCPANLRAGKYDDGKIDCWYYKRDWSDRKEEPTEIHALDLSDKEHHRQLFYVPNQMISNEYYGEPGYIGAMDWIALESQVGLYYRSLIENGFNPSIIIKFYRKPASQDEKSEIVRGLKGSFGGVKNSGKHMVLFSDGKELAPDVNPIEVSNVDKQFTVISDQITQKIITGERATTPELFGIAIPGQLGSGDFETKVKCFEKFVIRPDQRRFEAAVNHILHLNGYDVNYKLNQFTI